LGIRGVALEKLTFGDLIADPKQIIKKMTEIKELSSRAQGEVTIRQAIEELDVWCQTTLFDLTSYKQIGGEPIKLITEWNELMTKVGDNQALLQSIRDSKYYATFQNRITMFDSKIGGLDSVLTKLNTIQRKWVYLEPIFSRGSLPSEANRFTKLDREFKNIMDFIAKSPKVAGVSEIAGLDKSLNLILEQLEVCQAALNSFLENKRNKFPRFYFLGDEDLLEILGQADNPKVIKLHLKKLYAGIYNVEFTPQQDKLLVSAMISSIGESVKLDQPVVITGVLEDWLNE
jgi:dynein heavy chain 2